MKCTHNTALYGEMKEKSFKVVVAPKKNEKKLSVTTTKRLVEIETSFCMVRSRNGALVIFNSAAVAWNTLQVDSLARQNHK